MVNRLMLIVVSYDQSKTTTLPEGKELWQKYWLFFILIFNYSHFNPFLNLRTYRQNPFWLAIQLRFKSFMGKLTAFEIRAKCE